MLDNSGASSASLAGLSLVIHPSEYGESLSSLGFAAACSFVARISPVKGEGTGPTNPSFSRVARLPPLVTIEPIAFGLNEVSLPAIVARMLVITTVASPFFETLAHVLLSESYSSLSGKTKWYIYLESYVRLQIISTYILLIY